MSSQHKAPLAAFLVVSIACIVVVANALHDPASGLFSRPWQAVVASVRLSPQPQDIVSGEAHLVAGTKTGAAVAPAVVKKVVTRATSAGKTQHLRSHRAAGVATVVPAESQQSVPVNTATDTSGDSLTAGREHQPLLPTPAYGGWGHGNHGNEAVAADHPGRAWGRAQHAGRRGSAERSSAPDSEIRQFAQALGALVPRSHSDNGWGRSDHGHGNGDRGNGGGRKGGWGHGRH